MPLSLRLDADTERLVNRLSRSRGQTKSEVVREALRAFDHDDRALPVRRSVHDSIAHHIGCFHSGGKNLSKQTGPRFAALLRERKRGQHPR